MIYNIVFCNDAKQPIDVRLFDTAGLDIQHSSQLAIAMILDSMSPPVSPPSIETTVPSGVCEVYCLRGPCFTISTAKGPHFAPSFSLRFDLWLLPAKVMQDTVDNMFRSSGFVSKLAELYRVADSNNRGILHEAFFDVFMRHLPHGPFNPQEFKNVT